MSQVGEVLTAVGVSGVVAESTVRYLREIKGFPNLSRIDMKMLDTGKTRLRIFAPGQWRRISSISSIRV